MTDTNDLPRNYEPIVKPIHEWPDGVISPYTLALKFDMPIALAYCTHTAMKSAGYLTDEGDSLTVRGYHALIQNGVGMVIPHIFMWERLGAQGVVGNVVCLGEQPILKVERSRIRFSERTSRPVCYLSPHRDSHSIIDLGNEAGKPSGTGSIFEEDPTPYWFALHRNLLSPLFLVYFPYVPNHGLDTLAPADPPAWARAVYDHWQDTSPLKR